MELDEGWASDEGLVPPPGTQLSLVLLPASAHVCESTPARSSIRSSIASSAAVGDARVDADAFGLCPKSGKSSNTALPPPMPWIYTNSSRSSPAAPAIPRGSMMEDIGLKRRGSSCSTSVTASDAVPVPVSVPVPVPVLTPLLPADAKAMRIKLSASIRWVDAVVWPSAPTDATDAIEVAPCAGMALLADISLWFARPRE